MLKRLVFAILAMFVLSGTIAISAPSPAMASSAPSATSFAFAPMLAQAVPPTGGVDPTNSQFTFALKYITGLFTGGPAKFVIILAIIGSCIALLQRPDHHELIGNMTKIIIIGVVIIAAQTIVEHAFPSLPQQ